MPRGFIRRRNNFTKDTLLRLAAIGAITVVAATSPYIFQAVCAYLKDKSKEMARVRARKLQELKKRKLISFLELGGGRVRIELSYQGKNLVRLYNLEDTTIPKPKKWDGFWRMIIYDIPTSQKHASNAFRGKLKELGLYSVQRSAWVYPHEFLPEIEFLATVFEINIDNCICYLKLKNIPREEELKKFFNLV